MSPEAGLLRLARVAAAVWAYPLVIAAAGMLLGGILHATGRQELSALLVTGCFALSLVAVPLGLLALLLPDPSAGDPGADGGDDLGHPVA